MNNAFYVLEELEPEKPDTSDEEARLTRIIEAVSELLESKAWQTLTELHFSRERERIERLVQSEALKSSIDQASLYRLQGELAWARRYADLTMWVMNIKNQLKKLKHE